MCGGDDCERCHPSYFQREDEEFELPDEWDEAISDAAASGLINDAIDRCFEATMRGGAL